MGLNEHMIPFDEYVLMDRFFKIEDTIPDDERMDHRQVQRIYGQSELFVYSLLEGSESSAWRSILKRYAENHKGQKKRGCIPWKIVTFVCQKQMRDLKYLLNLKYVGLQIAEQYGIDFIGCYLSIDEVSAIHPLYTEDVKICALPVARVILSYTDKKGNTKPFPDPWPEKSYYIWRKFRNMVAYLPEHFE